MSLSGKSFLITGATGGIGGALARVLADRGVKLRVHGRDPERMAALLGLLPAGTQSLLADLSSAEGRAALVDFAGAGGMVDGVVLSAAGGHFGLFEQMRVGEIEKLIATDLVAPMLLTHALLPRLAPHGRSALVLIGSTLGQIGHPGFAAYGAAKGGLRTFAEALSRELGSEGPRLLWVSPRSTRTAMNSPAARAMNAELRNGEDPPEAVAIAIVAALEARRPRIQMGLAEKIFVRVNAMLPALVDRAMSGKLSTIRRHAGENHGVVRSGKAGI
jgi:short-subunit dehydrogenase